MHSLFDGLMMPCHKSNPVRGELPLDTLEFDGCVHDFKDFDVADSKEKIEKNMKNGVAPEDAMAAHILNMPGFKKATRHFNVFYM